jgi:hypothetical protein
LNCWLQSTSAWNQEPFLREGSSTNGLACFGSESHLELEIALSGDSARSSALGLLSSAEDALKRRMT